LSHPGALWTVGRHLHELKIAQVGVHHYPRRAGASTGNSPAVVAKAFRELVAFRRRLR